MGRDLGELGVPREQQDEPDTFLWFGHRFRVHPHFSDLRIVDFMNAAATIDEKNAVASMGALKGFYEGIVDPADYREFWQVSLDNGQGTRELMQLAKDLSEAAVSDPLVEAEPDRPTPRRTDSSSGRRRTAQKSRATSSRKVIHRMESEGRADLAQIVQLHGDARATG
jgi:hypothetical protein